MMQKNESKQLKCAVFLFKSRASRNEVSISTKRNSSICLM